MSDPLTTYLGQIEVFAFEFAPQGFAKCDGQMLLIAQNQALFSILGTTYGGDGRTTFGLPDLRGRTPIGPGSGAGLTPRQPGEKTGEENHTLTLDEIAIHSHWMSAEPLSTATNTNTPSESVIIAKSLLKDEAGKISDLTIYGADPAPIVQMHADSIQSSGGNAAHHNVMPYLTLNVCIAIVGSIPPRS
jgi:microcystin-dependent protein